MKTIHKFKIFGNRCTLALKEGAQILKIDEQDGIICLWALLDTETTTFIAKNLVVYGTGDYINTDEKIEHLATVQINTVFPLVLHVFEIKD